MGLIKLIIKLVVLPLIVTVTLIQWVGIFFTQFSTVIFNLLAGLMFRITIAGWMFGISAGAETLRLLAAACPRIQTYNAGLRKWLAAFSKKHPDLCRLEKSFAQGGVIYVLDKSRLFIRLQVPYSEECRRKASESTKQHVIFSKFANQEVNIIVVISEGGEKVND